MSAALGYNRVKTSVRSSRIASRSRRNSAAAYTRTTPVATSRRIHIPWEVQSVSRTTPAGRPESLDVTRFVDAAALGAMFNPVSNASTRATSPNVTPATSTKASRRSIGSDPAVPPSIIASRSVSGSSTSIFSRPPPHPPPSSMARLNTRSARVGSRISALASQATPMAIATAIHVTGRHRPTPRPWSACPLSAPFICLFSLVFIVWFPPPRTTSGKRSRTRTPRCLPRPR